jgi:hypothetical protein
MSTMRTISDAEFDAELEAYQEREYEASLERAERGDLEARRPDATRIETEFGALKVGDFMTAETGPDARWVKIVKVSPGERKWGTSEDGWVTVTFQTPQPLGVGMEDKWVLERVVDTPVTIDGSVRDA